MSVIGYSIISVILVSLVSVVFSIPFFFKKKISQGVLVFLLSLSVGVLLSTVFVNIVPEVFGEHMAHEDLEHHHTEEAYNVEDEHIDEAVHEQSVVGEHEHENSTLYLSLFIILGFLVMFLLEKFVHHHHTQKCENGNCGHSHAYNLAPVNILGDAIHNFIDGLVIAVSYSVNISLGIASTISIIIHEIPQEIADFGILLYSGLSKWKALLFNFLSALTAILGTVLGLFYANSIAGFNAFILPFAAGNFLYIAASNLVPQLHRKCGIKDTLMHIFAILLGVLIIVLITIYGPEHVHG